jgi:hypothetical protein
MKSAFEMALEICRELDGATGESGVVGEAVQPAQPDPLNLPVRDPYAERMRGALRETNRADYPMDMVRWLNRIHPDLYDRLITRLPDEISDLWTARAPLQQFEAVLTEWASLHRRCCDLCRTARGI